MLLATHVRAIEQNAGQSNPQPANQRRIALTPLWDSKMQGGTETMRDLQKLFAPHAKPLPDTTWPNELLMSNDIPYLCPLGIAESHLHVAGKISSRSLIACPGFPRGSIFVRSYDGTFENYYNRMYIIVDAADQLLSVQLVDESPKQNPSMHWEQNWFCYNFVNYRVKIMSRLTIAHELHEIRPNMFRIDSGLRDPGTKGTKGKLPQRTLELSRWYVPRPFVQLILYCISKASG